MDISEVSKIHNENRPENEHIYASTINEEVSGVSQLLTDDSLIIGAEESFGNIPSPPEAVLIEEQDSENLSRHHAGPIGEEFITDKRARQKSFSKRMKTFQKSAKLLNTMCGASVKFTVVSESGRQTIGSFPSAKVRHVGLQVGQPTGTPVTRHTSTGTPKKTPAKLVKKIKNIPGKKEKKITTLQKAINKCAVCGIIFKSNKDKLFQKKHGLQGVWLGCEAEGCVFWGHAICANVIIGSRKMIPSIKLHERHP